MKIKLTAPKGYRYRDTRSNKDYSEVITDERNRDKFVLVADKTETIKL